MGGLKAKNKSHMQTGKWDWDTFSAHRSQKNQLAWKWSCHISRRGFAWYGFLMSWDLNEQNLLNDQITTTWPILVSQAWAKCLQDLAWDMWGKGLNRSWRRLGATCVKLIKLLWIFVCRMHKKGEIVAQFAAPDRVSAVSEASTSSSLPDDTGNALAKHLAVLGESSLYPRAPYTQKAAQTAGVIDQWIDFSLTQIVSLVSTDTLGSWPSNVIHLVENVSSVKVWLGLTSTCNCEITMSLIHESTYTHIPCWVGISLYCNCITALSDLMQNRLKCTTPFRICEHTAEWSTILQNDRLGRAPVGLSEFKKLDYLHSLDIL